MNAGAASAVPGRNPSSSASKNVPGIARSFMSCDPPSAASSSWTLIPANGTPSCSTRTTIHGLAINTPSNSPGQMCMRFSHSVLRSMT